MRGTVWIAVLAVLLALLLSPFASTDVSELLPVQTLCLCTQGGMCRLETEQGLYGLGATPEQALRELERTAPGAVVLSTTRQLVVEDAAAEFFLPLLRMDVLRPGTELYHAPAPIDPADAADFLSRHGVDATVSRAKAAALVGEAYPIPMLVGGEGRYRIVGA